MTDEVIPLSRWRAALARARRTHRADAILAEPDADRLVPRLPVQELYYAIKEVGLADAHELVGLATAEQVQGFLDLDAWQKDQLDDLRMEPWIDALVDAGPEKLARMLEGFDAEVVALYVQRRARVIDLELDLPEDQPEGHYLPTPDGAFLLDVLPEGERGKSFERLIDHLYRADMKLGRHILRTARAEIPSSLEEHALRWRSGRMADLGYADFHEALAVYRWLDPATVKLDDESARYDTQSPLPTALLPALDETGFFARALATLGEADELTTVEGRLMTLTNRAMAADLVEPGDLDGARAALERVSGYLGIGLEYLLRGKLEDARAALSTLALEKIFRVGFSLTLQLKNLAATLIDKGRVMHQGRLLLDEPHAATLFALQQKRPLFSVDGEKARPFRALVDVGRVAAVVEEASQAAPLVWDALGIPIPDAVEEVTFGTLVRTWVAHLCLDGTRSLAPLGPLEIGKLAKITDEEARAKLAINNRWPSAWIDRWLTDFASAPARPGGMLVSLVR